MANITFGIAINSLSEVFAWPDEYPEVIGRATSKKVSILGSNGNLHTFYGSLKYNSDGSFDADSSTLTGLDIYQGTSKVKAFSISGISINAAAFLSHSGDGSAGIEAVYDSFLLGNDKITGSNYDDTLWGRSGSNKLNGGKGNDTLIADIKSLAVFDELTGGAGGDTFDIAFSSSPIGDIGTDPITGNGKVVIKDFKASQGDKISLSFYDSDWNNIDLGYDRDVFSGEAGSVIFKAGKKFGQLLVDTNGDSKADVFVQVYGANKVFDSSWLTRNPSQPV